MRIRSRVANDNRPRGAVGTPLFGHAGMLLPRTEPRLQQASFEMPVAWQWREFSIAGLRTERAPSELQLPLALPPAPPNGISRAIAPRYAIFMNMTVCSFFGRSRSLRGAAEHLARRGILYLGDMTRMTAGEIRFHLPASQRALADEFERRLGAIGLALNAKAPWWERPRDYYAIAY